MVRTCSPGAAMSTYWLWLEKLAGTPSTLVAPTEITDAYEAGYSGVADPEFPADATKMEPSPLSHASSSAASTASESAAPPKLMLMMSASRSSAAQWMQSI